MCEAYHVLPREGGALDQVPKEIHKLNKVLEILNEHAKDEVDRESRVVKR